ncbi:Nucleoside diphosphate kinase [Rickettsiales endosymbiont of Paramecium tredecaurelia]|uniref:nucleoside-diphosphate kinase n=1 Tax=Candidatus Sarmatiella mevalonica TaxID=2770581 RepID=UPI001920A044|nr:nucleoside-diphosphate kinase [Candidatus Sarmatiella mevalonica]MBL3284208.1 Nucleoside diphosphate kinase [Candidatus Sarmatiella mevalonica]
MTEHTLSIIKPDATKRNITGAVNAYFEKAGLRVVAQKMLKLTVQQASAFYAEHKERPFFNELVENITDGYVVVQVLQGNDAVSMNRKIMGAYPDPAQCEVGTIRRDLGVDISKNTVHGSDSIESAKREIAFFFAAIEIMQ